MKQDYQKLKQNHYTAIIHLNLSLLAPPVKNKGMLLGNTFIGSRFP